MSRDDGFRNADIDVGMFADPKVVALVRRVRDPQRAAAHLTLYLALVLQCWNEGARLTFDETLPAWWLEGADDARRDLTDVGLIDHEGRIPVRSWASWFGVAWERREKRRASGAEGGRRSWAKRRFRCAEPVRSCRSSSSVPCG